MRSIYFSTIAALCFLLACNPAKRLDHNFTYFQKGLDSIGTLHFTEHTIQPNDLLNIVVLSNTLNQEQAAVFNTANSGVTQGTTIQTSTSQSASGILVDNNGDIFYPFIGKLHIMGLTILQLKDTLEKRLLLYVKEPDVLVRLVNFKVNVLGAVTAPGTKSFTTPQVTILDAISAAGDLNENGRRENVLVLRQEKGTVKNYTVDLRDAKLYNSPVFQLHQNDMVYVRPNDNKLRTVKRNVNLDRDLSLTTTFLSIFSIVTSLYFIFKK